MISKWRQLLPTKCWLKMTQKEKEMNEIQDELAKKSKCKPSSRKHLTVWL